MKSEEQLKLRIKNEPGKIEYENNPPGNTSPLERPNPPRSFFILNSSRFISFPHP
jgi:hypothetical protein